jgi:hypothetical protein
MPNRHFVLENAPDEGLNVVFATIRAKSSKGFVFGLASIHSPILPFTPRYHAAINGACFEGATYMACLGQSSSQ